VEDGSLERRRLTFRRLTGLDRSGPAPPETRAGQPLRPWTIPNAIGVIRLLLIPLFLVLALSSDTGTAWLPALLFALVAWGDYADGMAARITRQYSRLGALMDPVVDRLLVISGVIVCWHFELLPRWGLAVLVAREVAVVVLARVGMSRGRDLEINWPGRLSVWPLMSGLFFALCGVDVLDEVLFFTGLALSLIAFAMYVRDGLRKTPPTASS